VTVARCREKTQAYSGRRWVELVGRFEECRVLLSSLNQQTGVVLSGASGVGKTRLALASSFPPPQWHDLSLPTSPGDIGRARGDPHSQVAITSLLAQCDDMLPSSAPSTSSESGQAWPPTPSRSRPITVPGSISTDHQRPSPKRNAQIETGNEQSPALSTVTTERSLVPWDTPGHPRA
jgi:hypothetical protein